MTEDATAAAIDFTQRNRKIRIALQITRER